MTQTSNTVAFNVSGAPAWFTSLADSTWTRIAMGASGPQGFQQGTVLDSVVSKPEASYGDANGMIRAWCGAAMLQTRGEYVKALQGGHSTYYGNEVLVLGLRDSVPSWKRIWGPSPANTLYKGSNTYNQPGLRNSDNTPTTMHGWFNRGASDGSGSAERIWSFGSNPAGNGEWTSDCWSIPRESLAEGVTDPALWVYHGRLYPTAYSFGSGFGYQSGPSAFDPATGKFMIGPEFDVIGADGGIVTLDVATCAAAGQQSYAGNAVPGATRTQASLGSNTFSDAWSVVTTNTSPRCWIVGSPGQNNLYVWNLDSPGTFRNKTTTGGTSVSSTRGMGAVYHAGMRKIIVGGPTDEGASFSNPLLLTIPTDPWNASTGFAWSTLSTSGGPLALVDQHRGTYSQWQMVNDMGNGRSCIVIHTDYVTNGTYVLKLPASF